MKRPLQITVIGSAADIGNSERNKELAYEIGTEVARKGFVLGYGGEKDVSSLSTTAAEGAKSVGGTVVALTYANTPTLIDTTKVFFRQPFQPDVVVPTGLGRGGGREYLIGLFGDAIIGIGGGSGTESEYVAAYQNDRYCIGILETKGATGQRFMARVPGVDQILDETDQPPAVRALFSSDSPLDFRPVVGIPWDKRRMPILGVETPKQAADLATILGNVYRERLEVGK